MDALERLTPNDLTGPEPKVVEAAVTATWCNLQSYHACENDPARGEQWGRERTIRAQLLRELLTGSECLVSADHPLVVRIKGARITGYLNLEAVDTQYPLHLDSCYLDCEQPVLLNEAHASTIRLTECYLFFGLDALQLETTGDRDLSGVRADNEVRLRGAHIGGTLQLDGGKFDNRNVDGRAIDAHGVQVDGDLLCRRELEADGEVSLPWAHIGGLLDLSGGKFRNRNPTGTRSTPWVSA